MTTTLFIVCLVVITALAFDFTNGFHDSANAMATSVATGALAPKVAVGIAAVLNVVGATLSTEVAKTISSGIVEDSLVSPEMVFAGLAGAIMWNLVTWLFGLPSSSSHALFGGLIGAVVVKAGMSGVHLETILSKIILPALVAPVVAGVAAALATRLAYKINGRTTDKNTRGIFRHAQVVSASMVALAHGTSDGQKTMGIITLVLVAAGYQTAGTGPHVWVILAAGCAIGLGTYSGGWRIMRTMGKGLCDIVSPQGFAAETSSTVAILASSHLGFALSTTHVCSGSILGCGLGRGTQVRWSTAGRMAIAWVVTLPCAAVVGALASLIAGLGLGGMAIDAALLLLGAGFILHQSRHHSIDSKNVNESSDVNVRKPGVAHVSEGAAA
ncbi:MAG: inorganic phosphate transporter [Acidipropionibacterium jensenii]|nr:inorganic phosphate transporter [Acidipropionibacterium jensenii]